MAYRPIFSIIWIFFLTGAILLLFFIILAGANESTPLNEFYWIQADTSAIPGAPAVSRWTNYGVCSVGSNGRNTDCTPNSADHAFSPVNNFHTTTNVPSDFITNRDTFFFLSRFSYPFYLIGLVFTVLSWFFSFCAIRSRLAAGVSSASLGTALLFIITAACLSTSYTVLGRNKFNDNGMSSHIGVKLTAFVWTTVALEIISLILLCCGCCADRGARRGGALAKASSFEKSAPPKQKRGFFSSVGRKNKTDAAFFADSESQRPVMQERSSFERT